MSESSTYDATPPAQPGSNTFNGCNKADDPDPLAPPLNPTTDLSAAEFNQACSLLIAYGSVIPTAIVGVTGGATPTVNSVLSPVQAVNGVTSAFVLTRVSAGIVWVEWATSTTLPAVRGQPEVSIVGTLSAENYAIAAVYGTGPSAGYQAVKVTSVANGALADLSFVLVWH